MVTTDPPPSMEDIPALLETMAMAATEKGEHSGMLPGWMRSRGRDISRRRNIARSAVAVKRIYLLCDVGHKHNRVPMVCSGKYDILTPLSQCLTQEKGDAARHLACLALNNLSIPTENKRVMALGPSSRAILGALCKVIAEDRAESYLCCICLMNLSFLEENITTILQHSPAPRDSYPIPPLQNSDSLIRILERLLKNASAFPKPDGLKDEDIGITRAAGNTLHNGDVFHITGQNKFKSEAETVRWACGLIKNLAKSEENANLLERTDIPNCIVENILRKSVLTPSRWLINSSEDFSLFAVLNLAQWPASRQVLVETRALDTIMPIMAEGGLQGLKATMACALLGAMWDDFPDGGSAAAKSISELMVNIAEKKGKEAQYAYGVFKLYTATKAYRDLCCAANSALGYDGAKTMLLDVPSAVALFHEVESDLSLAAGGELDGGSQLTGVKPVEYSVATINYIYEAASKVSGENNLDSSILGFDSNTMFDGFGNDDTTRPLVEKKII